MASAVVVLKHETATLRQRHNFISIELAFGMGWGCYTIPAKVGWDRMASRRPIYTILLTGYATELHKTMYLLFYASDSRH